MIKMNKLLTLIGATSALALTSQAITIFNDDFSGATIDSGHVASAADYYYTSTSGGIELDVVNTGLGMVSGSSGRGIHGTFAAQALSVGDTITLTCSFTTPATIGATSDSFKFGLFDSKTTDMNQGFSASSSTPNPLLDPPLGYYTDLDVSSTVGVQNLGFRESLAARTTGRMLGTSTGFTSISSGGTAYAFAADSAYTVVFSVLVGASDVTLTTSLLDAGSSVLSTYSATGTAGVSTFDTMAFWANSNTFGSATSAIADNGITFTDISVDVTTVPEASMFGLLLGAFAIGFVARRRR